MKKKYYIYHHLGLGDHIIVNGLIRKLIKDDGLYFLFCKKHNVDSVEFMFKDLTNLKIISVNNDLDVINSEEKPNLTLFRYEIGNNLMVYDDEFDFVYINHSIIWSFLDIVFGFNYSEIQDVILEWLSEVYDLRGVTTDERDEEDDELVG